MSTILIVAAAIAALCLLVIRRIPIDARIVDGDTIEVHGRRWRLSGYDAPEYDQPGGSQARERLRLILQTSRKIGVINGVDPYGRLMVTVFTTRGLLSHRMTWAGSAHGEGLDGYILTLLARLLGRGMWNGKHAVVTPRYWRATHPHPTRRNQYVPRPKPFRMPRLGMGHDSRKGLKLPGGFHIP